MKTRTLLFLAFGCGLAILLAGGIQLLRVADDGDAAPALSVGQEARVGDMRVTVLSAIEREATMLVHVGLIGVDDADGASGFRLVAPGGALAPTAVPSEEGEPCAATREATETRCVLAFDTAGAEGAARVLLYQRAGETQRWDLTPR